jgi:hypothetical protein
MTFSPDLDRRLPSKGQGVVSAAISKAKSVKSKAHKGATLTPHWA